MKEGVTGSAALLRAEPAPVITAASASAHLISRRGGGDNADKLESLGCMQCVFNTSWSSEMEKTTRGEKDMYIYIYMCVCVLEYLLPFIMRVFSGVLNAIFGAEDSDSTWGEAGRTFFSSSLERAQYL